MLRRRSDEHLGPGAGRGGRYLMRHKLLALGDDYYIENALGQRSTLSMAKSSAYGSTWPLRTYMAMNWSRFKNECYPSKTHTAFAAMDRCSPQ